MVKHGIILQKRVNEMFVLMHKLFQENEKRHQYHDDDEQMEESDASYWITNSVNPALSIL